MQNVTIKPSDVRRYEFKIDNRRFALAVSAPAGPRGNRKRAGSYELTKPDGNKVTSDTFQVLAVLLDRKADQQCAKIGELCGEGGSFRTIENVWAILSRIKKDHFAGQELYSREGESYCFLYPVHRDAGPTRMTAKQQILDFARRSDGSGYREIVPILHTLSFAHDPKTGLFMELVDRSGAFEGEHRMNELTGWGDAQALQLLERLCHSSDHRLQVRLGSAAASISKAELDSLLNGESVVWIGSPFNLNHAMVGMLTRRDYWDQPLRCKWRLMGRDGMSVEWPSSGRGMNEEVIHTWRTGGAATRVEYVLVARLQPRAVGGNLLICAGTDVMSTLEAAKLVLTDESGRIDWLCEHSSTAGSFEALFKIEVLNETIIAGPTRVWPDPEPDLDQR